MTIALLIASVIAAVITVNWLKPTDRNRIKLLIAFSGSYLLSITALHLLPEVFDRIDTNRGAYFGAFVLVGFFLQLMLEYLSGGIEHGHAHDDKTSSIPIGLLIGLCLHAFLEGMPLGGGENSHAGHSHSHAHDHSHSHDKAWQSGLLWGIVLHKYPVAIVFLSMLLNNGMSKGKAFGLLALFGAMAPLGTLLGGAEIIGQFHREILAIVIGIFLHVSTTILFESSEGHKFNAYKILAIAAGLALAAVGMLLHHH
jgi:zinc transporter ZupT